MEWVLRSPQIHSTFSNLGYVHPDGYHINENCNVALEVILHNILNEDKYLRTFRRSISFGQNIKKDLIPLLINAKEEKTIELLIQILVNLTIPIECLLSLDVISESNFGRHTIFEINNLLSSTKNAFTDHRATKVIIDFLKKNIDSVQNDKLQPEQCSNISNSLLLLRNILHIPENNNAQTQSYSGSSHVVQNQIIWNIFSQGVDKVLVKLSTVFDASNWGVTLVQLIALLYKDQHVVTLHKLLNLWLETSLSESSEDNESNMSTSDRGSEDSSPILTSVPTSDSSDMDMDDTFGHNSVNNVWNGSSGDNNNDNSNQAFQPSEQQTENKDSFENMNSDEIKDSVENQDPVEIQESVEIPDCVGNNIDDSVKFDHDTAASCTSGIQSQVTKQSEQGDPNIDNNEKKIVTENSDCGYGTQIENQESISTSSNEDDLPSKKPVHRKRHNPKQRANPKVRSGTALQDRKRKKIVKRVKSNILNIQGLTHKAPSDDDISNVIKEFTVDFLLKGYNSLVKILHNEILTNIQLEIDTSHFFWLLTYFLKFATQIRLELQHVDSVLSFDIVSYLTAEGAKLCEQFELAIKLDGNDLAPCIRRLHLVVTAIREFVQATDVYKKITLLNNNDQEALKKLQIKMCETEELRSLLVLLLRHYNPRYHSKQYLQDLIVTNHILLMFLDSIMKLPEYTCSNNMVDHIRQFASPGIMQQYGLLLEDYSINGEFINDCIFTVMHHVGGDLDSLTTLFQPRILKTFTSIWKSDFELCNDWSDLVEYVINTFIKKPHTLHSAENVRLDTDTFNDENLHTILGIAPPQTDEINENEVKMEVVKSGGSTTSKARWTKDEISFLSWTYLQCNTQTDCIGEITKLLKDDGIVKSRDSIVKELFNNNIVNKDEFDKLTKGESDRNIKNMQINKEMREDEISKLCEQLTQDGKSPFLDWVQKVLLETCHAKIYLKKRKAEESAVNKSKLLNFEVFKKNAEEMPVMSPVCYHAIVSNQSVPLVPWNCQQATIAKDLKFLQLLHKLGFHMPVDSGKVFIRIPHFWTADFVYDVAGKISPIDTTKLRFSINEFAETSAAKPGENSFIFTSISKDISMIKPDNIYQVHKQKHLATMVNFTPTPGCSYNSKDSEINHNWLKVVQKSQEFKLTLSVNSTAEVGDVVMTPPKPEKKPTPTPTPQLLMPTVMSFKQEVSTFDEHLADDYCNSLCETASVASDLTRMYVSDEDEKPEHLPPPRPSAPMLLPALEELRASAPLLQPPLEDLQPNAPLLLSPPEDLRPDLNTDNVLLSPLPEKRPRLSLD